MVQQNAIIITNGYDEEFFQLANSLDFNIINIFYFRHYSNKYFVGEGKLEEIEKYVKENNVDKILFNGNLKTTQWYNLEKRLGKDIYDRTRLILEIFADRAKSREARLEVELARLNYQIPLVREYIHKAKKGEHPGFMGGGEYDVDQYYFLIERRIRKIKDELEKIRREREGRRISRIKAGFYIVSIAGYTNSGKSQLMKALSGENVIVEDRMFSTLSTKIGKVISTKKRILITDTVGFIRDVPPFLIEAFNATLEDIFNSDLIILLIDAHDELDDFIMKLNTSLEILRRESRSKLLPVLNKMDLEIKDLEEKIKIVRNEIGDPVLISAKTGYGMDELVKKIEGYLVFDKEYSLTIGRDSDFMKLVNFVYNYGELEQLFIDDRVNIKFKINSRFSGEIQHILENIDGEQKITF